MGNFFILLLVIDKILTQSHLATSFIDQQIYNLLCSYSTTDNFMILLLKRKINKTCIGIISS